MRRSKRETLLREIEEFEVRLGRYDKNSTIWMLLDYARKALFHGRFDQCSKTLGVVRGLDLND